MSKAFHVTRRAGDPAARIGMSRAAWRAARATAFEETFEHTRPPFSGHRIAVPITVAFGDRDWILTKRSRCRNALPAHTKWIDTRGWGHVPMWIDPAGVAQLILEGTGERTTDD